MPIEELLQTMRQEKRTRMRLLDLQLLMRLSRDTHHRVVPMILACLSDNNAAIRTSAIAALGKLNAAPESVHDALYVFLTESIHEKERNAVWKIVRKIGDKKIVYRLLPHLYKRRDMASMVKTIVYFKMADLVPHLLHVLDFYRPDSKSGRLLQRAIANLGGNDLLYNLRLLRSDSLWDRMEGADRLGEAEDKRTAKALFFTLRDKNPFVRKAAARALVKMYKNDLTPVKTWLSSSQDPLAIEDLKEAMQLLCEGK